MSTLCSSMTCRTGTSNSSCGCAASRFPRRRPLRPRVHKDEHRHRLLHCAFRHPLQREDIDDLLHEACRNVLLNPASCLRRRLLSRLLLVRLALLRWTWPGPWRRVIRPWRNHWRSRRCRHRCAAPVCSHLGMSSHKGPDPSALATT